MQSRRPVYDSRNTVELSIPSERNRSRREIRKRLRGKSQDDFRLMDFEPKVAMANVCRWCGMALRTARAICPHCITCQYCGLVPSGSHACEFCGNRDLDIDKSKPRPVVRREMRAPDAPEHQRRSVRRAGPQNRRQRAILGELKA